VRELKNHTIRLLENKNPDLMPGEVENTVFKRYTNSVVEGSLKKANDTHESVKLASLLG